MTYAECVVAVVVVVSELTETPTVKLDASTKVGNKFQQVADRFFLIGCNPNTTIGEIAQVLYEREVVSGH